MTSTLFGIYNAQRSLSLNQAVIDIINNNIANINTPGYSKQRAEIAQLTSGSISTIAENATQDSMGAVIESISRNRDAYLDTYYRNEKSDFSYYKELNENSLLIEDIVSEIDNTGINSSLNEFYQSLSELASNSNDYVLRNNVVQKAIALTTKLNTTYTQLENLRESLVGDYTQPNTLDSSKVKVIADDINDKLGSIADISNTIIISSSQGNAPNYLLDQRDKLLDEISEYIPVDITEETNGSVSISLGGTLLVSGKTQTGFFSVTSGDIDNPATLQIENESGGIIVSDAYSLVDSGQLGAVLEMAGSDSTKLTIKSVMDSLDTLAVEFSDAINTLQLSGQYIDSTASPPELATTVMYNFFVDDNGLTTDISAKNIYVNSNIVDDPYFIAAADASSGSEETGDGANALLMAQVRDDVLAGLGGATAEQYIINTVSDIGSKASRISTNYDIKNNITQQLSLKRESVIGVNLDEEMADLIRFQRSYEASARIFSVVDQNIKIILGMVG